MFRKAFAISTTVVLLALTLTGCSAGSSPEDQVRNYLQALADGDGEKALEIIPADEEDESSPLLSDEVFANATERITNIDVTAPESTETATVEVPFSYELAGSQFEGVAMLKKVDDGWTFLLPSDGNELGQFEQVIVPNAGSGIESATIGDLSLELSGDDDERFAIFPGVYERSVSADPRLTVTQPDPLIATAGGRSTSENYTGSGEFIQELAPTEDTVAEAVIAANAVLEECLANASNAQPEGCPFSHDINGAGIKGTWEVTSTYTPENCSVDRLAINCRLNPDTITFVNSGFAGGRDTGDLLRFGDINVGAMTMKAQVTNLK